MEDVQLLIKLRLDAAAEPSSRSSAARPFVCQLAVRFTIDLARFGLVWFEQEDPCRSARRFWVRKADADCLLSPADGNEHWSQSSFERLQIRCIEKSSFGYDFVRVLRRYLAFLL